MGVEYCNFPLEISDTENFELARAKTCLKAVQNSPYCTMVSLNKIIKDKDFFFKKNDEILIFDSEVEIPQYPKNDIKQTERIAIIFSREDKRTPWVFALRKNFPESKHQNSFFLGYPKSLCIYDKLFDELKISWSSGVFIEDIRNWLKLTAKDKLHQDDQQLEPFVLLDQGDIILPNDIKSGDKLFAYAAEQRDNRLSVLTSRNSFDQESKINFQTVILLGQPQVHGLIKFAPQNCKELQSFLLNAGINFRNELEKALKENKSNGEDRLLFLILLPKQRNTNSPETVTEIHSYIFLEKIQDVGIKIGLWELFNGLLTEIINFNSSKLKPESEIDHSSLSEVKIGMLKPHFSFNRTQAALLNNNTMPLEKIPNVLCIGLGALGSQVFMNLARSGWGKWNLVDDDILLPHNLARHSLYNDFLTWSKVKALSYIANNIISDNTFSIPVFTNILRQQNEEETKLLNEKINECDVIFDFSATISVPRHLCSNDIFSKKRILSSFLNPAGNCSVILYEDANRNLSIDIIEMLFYRELSNNLALHSYFTYKVGGSIRYSSSCKDISNQIPQDYLAIHAAITSNFIKNNFYNANARAVIISYNAKNMNVIKHEIIIPKFYRYKVSEWEIIIDEILIEKIYTQRKIKLPNETGGILIGSWDVEYKRIYILDTVIPSDNSEYPTFFYRGIDGLREQLLNINKTTAGMLKYVGEWHSHPDNCSTNPSHDDLGLLSWLTENMSYENLPAIMLIMGENKEYHFSFGKIIDG